MISEKKAPEKKAISLERFKPPPFGTRGYTIQLGAWTSKREAYDHTVKLHELGFSEAYIMDAVVKGTTYYRVRVGVFKRKSAATRQTYKYEKYTKEKVEPPWVTQLPK